LFGNLNLQFVSREYSAIDRKDDDSTLSATLGLKLTRDFSLSLQYTYFRRNSRFDTDEFDENRVFLTLSYLTQRGQ
jgi:uncharacterized protein (PEP-CTERM system associated)